MKIILDAYNFHNWLYIKFGLPHHPKQNGSELTNSGLERELGYLSEQVSEIYECKMEPKLNASSYRIQEPTKAAFALHQDYEALKKVCDPLKDKCCTVWIPLVDIDNYTPTLEISPREYAPLPHIRDELNYAIINPNIVYVCPLVSITDLRAGTGVLLDPFEIHRSCVQPWHTKTRQSLDIRFAAAA